MMKPPKDAKIRTSLVKIKQKNGWIYVKRVKSFYDPTIKNSRNIEAVLIGKLPPGEEDISKMIPTEPRKRSSEIPAALSSVPDSRAQHLIVYPLDTVLFVTILAMVNGCTSDYQVAEFWKTHRQVLAQWIPHFPKEDISHDTINRLVSILGRSDVNHLIGEFTKPLMAKFTHRTLCMDGQAVRATKNEQCPQGRYILNLYDADNLMSIQQQLVNAKTNEITHACELIKHLDLDGATITCDALNTQSDFVSSIIDKGADYCVAVKKNQKGLFEQVRGWFETSEIQRAKCQSKLDCGHGRVELRTIEVLPGSLVTDSLKTISGKWPGLHRGTIIRATTEMVNKKTRQTSQDTRYFISSLRWDKNYIAERLMTVIRTHWSIENQLHWVLDVLFDQDNKMCKNARYLNGWTALNKLSYNLLSKLQTDEEISTARKASSRPVWQIRLSDLAFALNTVFTLFKAKNYS